MGVKKGFCRVVHALCKPFVKLSAKTEQKLAQIAKDEQSAGCAIRVWDNANPRDSFFARIRVITHAGGGMQGCAYLNCVEAFPFYYEQGNRVFEYDVEQNDMGAYVLRHTENGKSGEDVRYTPLGLDRCLEIIQQYPDITVIFDCKCEVGAFASVVKEKVQDERALSRIVIQVFNEADVLAVKAVHDFKLLHVCMLKTDYEKTLQTCIQYHIGAVSISVKGLQERCGWELFDKNNVCVFAYTVNDLDSYSLWKQRGITGVFSDFLYEKDLGKAVQA